MANIIISRTVDLGRAGNTEFLSGSLFADENLAHTFAISATRNGAEIALSGVVTACFIRPDGGTVELNGTIEDGKACVTLAESCYVVTGRFKLTIFVSVDGAKTAVYCAAGNVVETTTNTIIDPGSVVPSVDDIIAEYGTMQQAVEDCNTAKNNANSAAGTAITAAINVAGAIADPYNSMSAYPVGSYCTRSAKLYKCNTAIPTGGETWTEAHWTEVQTMEEVGDLKSAIDEIYEVKTVAYEYADIEWSSGYLKSNGDFKEHAAYKTSAYLEVIPGSSVSYDGLRSIGSSYPIITGYTEDKSFVSDANVSGTGSKDTGTYTVPSNIHFIRVVTYNYNGENYFDSMSIPERASRLDTIDDEITAIEEEQTQQDERISDLEEELNSGFEYAVDGFDDYAISISGGITKTGGDYDFQYALRSAYISTENIISITAHIKAINNYECAIASYDENKNFISEKSLICYDPEVTGGTWIYCDGTIVIGNDVKYIRITRGSNSSVSGDDTITTVRSRSFKEDYEATKATVDQIVTENSIWKGKKWYAFGTSLTDSTYLDPNDDPTGKYPELLNQHMQAILVNKGKGGGGITSHSNGAILTAIQNTDFSDADLVTLEGFPNDYSAAPGSISDTTTDTLCGALYVALSAIYNRAPNATVVLITASQGKLNQQGTAGYPIDFISATGNRQVDYNNAIIKMGQYFGCHVIDAGGKAQINNYHPEYLVDHIHHSWAGGWQFAETIWEEIKKIHPNTANPYFEEDDEP